MEKTKSETIRMYGNNGSPDSTVTVTHGSEDSGFRDASQEATDHSWKSGTAASAAWEKKHGRPDPRRNEPRGD